MNLQQALDQAIAIAVEGGSTRTRLALYMPWDVRQVLADERGTQLHNLSMWHEGVRIYPSPFMRNRAILRDHARSWDAIIELEADHASGV